MAIIFFIFGLIIGSFLNAVVYRLNAVESLLGRSHCPNCRKKIRWHDNIPLLSYVVLSAKCRDCGERISWIYPAVEVSTGIIFALVGSYFFKLENPATYLPTLFYLAIFPILTVIFVYDFKYMEIPMVVLWGGVGVSVAYLLWTDATGPDLFRGIFSSDAFSGMLAGAVSFIFFFSLAFFSKETWMGYGDAYIGLLAGLVVGWPAILLVLVISFSLGAFLGIMLVLSKKKNMKSQVPFAPFLVSGILLTVFLPKIFPQIEDFMPFF